MNKSKFSLADVITLLVALGFGFVCFLGANFYTLGNTTQSIAIASIITLLLGITALGAKWLKQTRGNFKTYFVFEIIVLVLFTGLTAYFTYAPFSHYFLVSDQKVEIQEKLTASITQAEKLYNDYEKEAEERMVNYQGFLNSVVSNRHTSRMKFDSLGFQEPGVPFQKQIKNKMETMRFDLFPSNFKSMKVVDSTWLSKSKKPVNDWKPIGIVEVIKNIEGITSTMKTKLIGFSTIRQTLENANDFEPKLTRGNVNKYFTTLGKPTLLSICLAVTAWLLMLISYLISKRDTRSPIGRNKTKDEFDIEF